MHHLSLKKIIWGGLINKSINHLKKEQENGCAWQLGYIYIVEHQVSFGHPDN